MAVKTRQVSGRRTLDFHSYDEMLADVRMLAATPHRQLGNWSLGEVCQHLAKTIDGSLDGSQARAPWMLRMVGPFIKKRFLSRPMSPGFTAPPAFGLLPDPTADADGVAALEKAVERFRQTGERHPHLIFGAMTREEWDQLHMRHSAMHLSFLVPES